MKLARFSHQNRIALGRVDGDRILDLGQALPSLPPTLIGVLEGGANARAQIAALQATAENTLPLEAVTLLAPIPRPAKYLAIGMNYQAHADEVVAKGVQIPDTQVWFNKQTSCVNDPYAPIHLPLVSDKLDYEVELGVVIGRRCRHVPVEQAQEVIGGYLVTNDVTVRDWQMRSFTWTLGKSFDTHGPIGPWLVTADEVPDPHALEMKLWVNGELRQHAITNDMIYNIHQQIAHLSEVMTLEVGDLIATGTPSGAGVMHEPPRFLALGDVVRAEISGLGHIENRVIAEPAN